MYLFMPKAGGSVSGVSSSNMILVLVAVVAFGVGIVIFATKSAMKKSPNKTN